MNDFTTIWLDHLKKEKVEFELHLSSKRVIYVSQFTYGDVDYIIETWLIRELPFNKLTGERSPVRADTELRIRHFALVNAERIQTTDPTEIHPQFDPSYELDVLAEETQFDDFELEAVRVNSFMNSVKLIDIIGKTLGEEF